MQNQLFFVPDSGPALPSTQGKDKKQSRNNNHSLKLHSIQTFEPHGFDVYTTQMLLNLQFLLVAVACYDEFHEIKKGHLKGQKIDSVRILYGLFSIPFLILSIVLFLRFKHAYCRQNSRNIVIIGYLMIFENIANVILRFTVGLKVLLVKLTIDSVMMKNFMLPLMFVCMWIAICYVAYCKNGDYGAPPGMLYMQYCDEIEEKQRQITQDYQSKFTKNDKQELPSFGDYMGDESTNLLGTNDQFFDQMTESGCDNQTILNYEDTEELPDSENMDQCYYDRDIEKQPLYQPRSTLKAEDLQDYKNISFESSKKLEVRLSCPDNDRQKLAKALARHGQQIRKEKKTPKNHFKKYQAQKNFLLNQKREGTPKSNQFAPSLQKLQLYKTLANQKCSRQESDKLSSFSVSSSTSSTLSLQLIGKPKINLHVPQIIVETSNED